MLCSHRHYIHNLTWVGYGGLYDAHGRLRVSNDGADFMSSQDHEPILYIVGDEVRLNPFFRANH